ncbi:endophilin-B1 isoform X2 [Planococcus citri]|uniref:endophilin-B1 isoform X2 n=1 Tax=Planococcus citri TaxID=170843 RepID=UPI0031F966E3
MDFNVKKLVKDAGTAISRVVQLTEEKLGTSEKTELDSHFENLAERADVTKRWTERIVGNTEAVLTPNPGNRVEDYLFEKIDKKKPNRLSTLEYLGIDMIEAGNEFGPGTSYGSALIKVGQCEQRLGSIERDFIHSANQSFIGPLHKFLDGEMKTISKERSILETKRLDLDACKNRVRKARNMLGTPANAERDLRVAQSEFDRQAEITKLLLEGVSSSHSAHLRCLHEFVNCQARYYAECHQRMQELQKELSDLCNSGHSSDYQQNKDSSSESFVMVNERPPKPQQQQQRTNVITDYETADIAELSLVAEEM